MVAPSPHFNFFLNLSMLIFAALAKVEMTNEDSGLKLNSSKLSRSSWLSQTLVSVLVFLTAVSVMKHHPSV